MFTIWGFCLTKSLPYNTLNNVMCQRTAHRSVLLHCLWDERLDLNNLLPTLATSSGR